MKKTLKILSYNIHKGFSSFNTKFVLEQIRNSIRTTKADILFLQEVMGESNEPSSQFEYIADQMWPHFAYGKNAVYTKGHHGNAILSKYPITHSENLNISTNAIEKRGMLHAVVEVPQKKVPLHLFCTHLDLLEKGRKKQITHMSDVIRTRVPPECPFILAGDFNDWRETLSSELKKNLLADEAYLGLHGAHKATYPSWLPKLKIDRVYFSRMTVKDVHYFEREAWGKLSDHLPIMAELEW